ncbi:DUF2288 domain-containing protein [Geomonas sp. Red32]|uniref:DUF2288 domain-containing protein n=1 Tax=Geomonas sp. Red32 TaxID=2912856 RepID=UPI00202D0744|nr:DUF2288 domain-containing protein [Geomonas sp. Red32]MCM0080906.1 DUF2288 domain-containing protein [Geomonas sp. Red32]
MTVTKEELATKVDLTDWFSLRAHLERGGVILVDPMLDLAEVGVKMAEDDVKTLERWVSSGMVGKPSAELIGRWDAEKKKMFRCVIVSPFVLVQEEQPGQG